MTHTMRRFWIHATVALALGACGANANKAETPHHGLHHTHIAVIDAPFNLGLRPPAPGREPGTRELAAALRAQGLVSRLNAVDGGVVPAPPYVFERDPISQIANAGAIRTYTAQLSNRVAAAEARGEFALVLGGDCSILVGALMAASRGKHRGLVFMDAHTDFSSPPAVGAGIELSLVTGNGPNTMRNFGDRTPLVREEDVVLLGLRDPDDTRELGNSTAMHIIDFRAIRQGGARESARRTLAQLRSRGVDELWIHLDADVLDDDIMPAVDSRSPGGLSYAELIDAVSELLSSGIVSGMDITVFDPDRDPTGTIAPAFANAIVEIFARAKG